MNEPDIYILTIKNADKGPLFISIDSTVGMLLYNYRFYTAKKHYEYQLLRPYPIICYGPSVKDTIYPFQQKQYYTPIGLPENGVVELNLYMSSNFIDSLNASIEASWHENLKINHPFFIFKISDKKIGKPVDDKSFHRLVRL